MNKFAADTKEMTDHEGIAWSNGPTEDSVEPRSYGIIDLADVKIGTRVRLLDGGNGPYDDNGMPVTKKGGVLRHEYEAVVNGFEDVMVDDGLYEKHAKVTLDNGKSRWIALTVFGPPFVKENGQYIGMAAYEDSYLEAVGAVVI